MGRPGVCTPWADLSDMPCVDYATDPVAADQALRFASDVLYDLSGRQWPGECVETVRPCATRSPGFRAGWWPVGDRRGSWGSCSCNRARRCGCSSISEVRLGSHVLAVTEVRVDGEVVPPVEYAVDDEQYLVGLTAADGTQRRWPCCQRLDREPTGPGTWAVTFSWGGLPPDGGVRASAALGCELLKAASGDKGCRLPKRVTSIVRQGVTVAVLDPLTLFADGATGLPEVDLWLGSVRYGRAHRPARLLVPGRGRRATRRN